ncbi:MAG: phage terminase small subunit P27 family [Rhizobiales bacterium]|nr:phage terminase small subunit P27 family [Hyphomicrobiales bacterium]
MRGVKPYLAVDNTSDMKEAPEPPEWIGEFAAVEWRRVAPDLVARGRLNEADLGTLESYCIAIGQVKEMQRQIAIEGAVINDPKRGPRKHPAVSIRADAMTQARLLANELGLTPVSRQRPGMRGNGKGGGSAPADQGLFDGLDF